MLRQVIGQERRMLTEPVTLSPGGAASESRLRKAAEDLEASFIAEMLRAAGAEKTSGLGAEDSEFASFLLDARAREITRAGGLGLAEVLFESMVKNNVAR
jgi:Rod binding domain-containing protein